jgi:CRISPR-associated protein Csm1
MNEQPQKRIEREIFFLAGLLHDIGKFWQRADKNFLNKENELSEYSKKLANDICPVNDQGRFGYQHVVWSNEFLEKFKSKLEKIPGLKENIYSKENSGENNISNFAVNHHKPRSLEQAIITLADWWSAGIDRTEKSTLEKAEDTSENINWGNQRYKSIPLYSIFNGIYNGTHKNAFPLKSLDIKSRENIFPSQINNREDGVSEQKYKELWTGFTQEFDKLPSDSLKNFIESLMFLLKKYTWSIPSNTMDMANVSLYEHLKTTAAFADCLYEFYLEKPESFQWNAGTGKLNLTKGTYPVIMLGGDISGIQKFIYNIASRKAAMSLKGRSFYLQLLIDSIIQRIISHEQINATAGHVIYSSGGKFYMLLPNTESVREALKNINVKIEKELWEQHKGRLIFNMDYLAFAYVQNNVEFEGDTDKTLGGLWKTLADKLIKQKNQKFRSLIFNSYDEFFEVIPDGGDVDVCAVSGENLAKGKAKKADPGSQDPTLVSEQVMEQIKLGKVLKDADFNIMYKGKADEDLYLSKRSRFNINVTGISNHLFKYPELEKDHTNFSGISSADISRVNMINDTNFLSEAIKGQGVSYGFQFYGGNRQAMKNEDEYKTFEELTQVISGNPDSETYFGILRMDVDGLGHIFIKGLDEKNKSFSAYATLSFLLDMFFSGYLNTIRDDFKEIDESGNEVYKYRDSVNILYSGGDDVFAVGRWDKIIAFAEDIRQEFAAFTGRKDISLSGGVAIVNNKFPIAKAAEIAGEAEKKAKKYNGIAEKNAFCFLGETISWEKEYPYVKKRKNDFVRLIEKSDMSKGILHRLMLYAGIKKENERKLKENSDFVPDLSYKWHTAYYLKRFMERHKKKTGVNDFIAELQVQLFEPRNYDLVSLAARWAELEIKITKREN